MSGTTTTKQRYAHEVCPEPSATGGATLEQHTRYHLARAHGLRCLDTDHPDYLTRLEHSTATAHTALLLYALHTGKAPAEAAEFAHVVLCDGDGDEWVWEALTDLGVDPESIRPYEMGPKRAAR